MKQINVQMYKCLSVRNNYKQTSNSLLLHCIASFDLKISNSELSLTFTAILGDQFKQDFIHRNKINHKSTVILYNLRKTINF